MNLLGGPRRAPVEAVAAGLAGPDGIAVEMRTSKRARGRSEWLEQRRSDAEALPYEFVIWHGLTDDGWPGQGLRGAGVRTRAAHHAVDESVGRACSAEVVRLISGAGG